MGDYDWQAFQTGNREAFSRIYSQHYEALLNYGRRFCLDNTAVEDAIQDVFVEMWHYRASLSNVQSVRFYLLRVLRNKLNQHFRKQASVVTTDDALMPFDVAYSFENQLIEQEVEQDTLARLRQCLNELSPRQKEILYLRFFNVLDYQQIADLMGLSYQATRNQLYLALKALRERLTPFWNSLIALIPLICTDPLLC
jgi:RNA polymerase sigma factor (sigma-70 family)